MPLSFAIASVNRWKRGNQAVLGAVFVVTALACGGEDALQPEPNTSANGGSGGGGEAGGGGAAPEPIVWEPCPAITDGPGTGAECAEIEVPLFWDDPQGEHIVFFVKRYLGAEQPSRAQLWFLQGGPGNSVVTFEDSVALYATDPTVDIYLPEQRGVGRSTRLGCPPAEEATSEYGYFISPDELASCIPVVESEWGDRLQGFTISNAARDIGDVIARTRRPDQDVFLAGHSYGTHWLHRYMQIFPTQATGVAMIATAIDFDFWRLDGSFDALAKTYFDACGIDTFCLSKLGPDPWQKFTDVMLALEAGACPEAQALGFDRAFVRVLAAEYLYWWDWRTVIPPLVYRLDRCSPSDIAALQHFATGLSAPRSDPLPPAWRFYSPILRTHIALSELWDSAPSFAELQAIVDGSNAAYGTTTFVGQVADTWPRYTPESDVGDLVETDLPMLILEGELDFTPMTFKAQIHDHFSGPYQNVVIVPRAPHNPHRTPVTCTRPMVVAFTQDPQSQPDTTCLDSIPPLSFQVDSGLSNVVFGTTDAWEG